MRRTLPALLAALLLSGCAAPERAAPAKAAAPAPITVAAASSLRDAFEEIGAAYRASGGGTVTFDYAASSVLQKQIEGGAPIDVFASASPKQIDALIDGGLVSAEETEAFAGNELVVFVPKDDPKGIAGPEDLEKAERLAIGNPEIAPHGTKAKEWLTGLGIWDSLEGRSVFAENSAQTLAYVTRGEVDAGIGFASEVLGSDEVEVAYTVPKGEIEPIRYVVAPVKATKQPEAASRFVTFLLSAEGQAILAKYGFVPSAGK